MERLGALTVLSGAGNLAGKYHQSVHLTKFLRTLAVLVMEIWSRPAPPSQCY